MTLFANKKILGVTLPRSGSSYFFNTLGNLLNFSDPLHLVLNEIFSPNNKSKIIFKKDNVLSIKNNDNKIGKKIAFERAIKLPKYLYKSKNNFTCKIMIYQLNYVNNYYFNKLMTDNNIIKIFLYRKNIEELLLSFIIAQSSTIISEKGNLKNILNYNIKPYKYNHYNNISKYLMQIKPFISLYYAYNWDYIIDYDNLIGNPSDDFKPWVSEKDIKKLGNNYYKKLHSYSEKKDNLINYDQFKSDFKYLCNEMEIDSVLPFNKNGEFK